MWTTVLEGKSNTFPQTVRFTFPSSSQSHHFCFAYRINIPVITTKPTVDQSVWEIKKQEKLRCVKLLPKQETCSSETTFPLTLMALPNTCVWRGCSVGAQSGVEDKSRYRTSAHAQHAPGWDWACLLWVCQAFWEFMPNKITFPQQEHLNHKTLTICPFSPPCSLNYSFPVPQPTLGISVPSVSGAQLQPELASLWYHPHPTAPGYCQSQTMQFGVLKSSQGQHNYIQNCKKHLPPDIL